jgi:alkylation response protein AidB-like acyl-CoA dehydrogenase
METPGIEVRPIECMDGTAHFCEVFYNDVRIPLSNVVGELNGGWGVAMATLGFERGTGLLYDQIEMSRLVESYIEQARTLPGPDGIRPAIKDDEIAARLATLRAEVAALRSMSYATISGAQRNGSVGAEATMVALYTTETMQKVYRMGLDLLGTAALELPREAHSAQYLYLSSFMYTIGGGTSEIRRNIIGERALGLPKGK